MSFVQVLASQAANHDLARDNTLESQIPPAPCRPRHASAPDLDKLFRPPPAGFQTIHPLHEKLTIHNSLQRSIRQFYSENYGKRPSLKHTTSYTQRIGSFGIGPEVNGEQNLHGAVDNASGSGSAAGIGARTTNNSADASRTLLFLSVTEEEQGLLAHNISQSIRSIRSRARPWHINMDG